MHTDDAQVLVLRRALPFDFWQSVTGSLDPGEQSAEAAKRELREETGLTDEGLLIDTGRSRTFVIDPRWRDRYPQGVTENREHEWRYRLALPCEICIDTAEHSEWRWVAVDEAIGTVWSWTNREALEVLRDDLQQVSRGG